MQDFWKGSNIRLRALEPDDWQKFFHWNQDLDLMSHLDQVHFPPSREETKEWVAKKVKKNGKKDSFLWVIEDFSGAIVGSVSTFMVQQRVGTFYYAILVDPAYQRKGYAFEAVRLVLKYFFRELRYQKCTSFVYDFNRPSQRFHEKLGFTLEGRLRRMGHSNGRYYDFLLYGILAEEFG